jgi:hypothetical protein
MINKFMPSTPLSSESDKPEKSDVLDSLPEGSESL